MKGIDRPTFALWFFLPSFVSGVIYVFITEVFPIDNKLITDFVFVIGTFISTGFSFAAILQRLVNLQLNPSYFLVSFIPLINFGFLFYLLFQPTPEGSDGVRSGGLCIICDKPYNEEDLYCSECGYKFKD